MIRTSARSRGGRVVGVVARTVLAATAAILCLCAIAPEVRGDDGSVETVGGAVRLMKDHGSVRMVSETVRAHVTADSIIVDCVFVMKNDGPKDTVLVGFPAGSPDADHEAAMDWFRSWVDGVEVACQFVPGVNEFRDDPETASWWTKRVAFRAGGTRTIRDRYSVRPSCQPISGTSDFDYVLWTGASWKGTIGTAEITVTLDGIKPEWITGVAPAAPLVGRTLHWSLRNFEPGSTDGSPREIWVQWREPGTGASSTESGTSPKQR